MDKKALKLLGINSESYCPQDVYDRIEKLNRCVESEKGLKRIIEIYRLDRKLQTSETPLTDIACFWDSHLPNGSSCQVGMTNILKLCRELEKNCATLQKNING